MQNQFRDITVSSLNNEILGEECSTSFNRLKPRVNPRSLVNSRLGKAAIAVEDRFWNKKFHAAPEIKLNGKVTCVHFSADGQHCAVTSSTKVVAYNSKTGTVAKEFTRFKGVAYGGKFRNDSRLLVAGGEEKYVRVFDSASRSVLRTFQGHKDSIHATEFLETEPSIVLSGSDDCTMKTWDMRSALLASEFLGHSDRIRTVSQNSQGKYIISGSYDHVIKVWDPRKGSESVLSMEHGSPVQSVLSLPGGSLIASAGDNEIKVWDILNGGSLVHSFSNHQKQITALSLDGTKERLVSASLDQFVKIYDLSNYEVTSSLRFDDPILSMDIAVGCVLFGFFILLICANF